MKLLYVAPSAYLLGGVQDWLADLVAAQRQMGLSVAVAVPDDTIHRLEPYARRYPQLHPLPFRNPTGSAAGRIRALEILLRQHPDHLVVAVNMGALYPAVRRLRRQGLFRGRLVVSLHALEADYFADLRAERDLLDAVVVSNRLGQALVRDGCGLAAERVLYAPYGVAIDASPPAASAAAGQPLDPATGLRIAWVGRLEQPQKRVHDLRAVLEALAGQGLAHRLTIAGDGPERARLEAELAPWIARGLVRCTGAIPRQELAERVYGAHDVLLITSQWETGPIVAWEAMAAGMAVVSSRYLGSGLEQALVHGVTAGLFPIGDGAAAAAELARLQAPGPRRTLARGGFELVQRRYSQAASLAAWTGALEAAAALEPLPAPAPPAPLPAAGSLDRALGARGGEWLRRRLGRRFVHREAGSEWPHSGHGGCDPTPLLARARRLDAAARAHG